MSFENEKWVLDAIEVFRLRYFGFYRLDKEASILAELEGAFFDHREGKLKKTRQALQLSVRGASLKMRIQSSAWTQFEEREATGNITLRKLSQAAEALDCELVYGLRPKSREPFYLIAWKRLWPQVLQHRALKAEYFFQVPERRRTLLLASITGGLFSKARDRRERGWFQQRVLPEMDELVGNFRERQWAECARGETREKE